MIDAVRHDDHVTVEHGEVTMLYELWSDTINVSNGPGYDYTLDFGTTAERAVEIFQNFGFDESELYDLVQCLQKIYEIQQNEPIS